MFRYATVALFTLAVVQGCAPTKQARDAGIPLVERDLDLFDAYTAEEAFLTSTSLCICPVQRVNGVAIGGGGVPGPVTRRLTEAYRQLVDFDFVAQYLKRLDA